jgi:hypothetical protein
MNSSAPTRSVLLPALLLALPLAACGHSINTPASANGSANVPANYPPTIVESSEHLEAMRAEWARLFEAYGVPADRRKVPDLQPVTHTPQSILGIGPLRIVAAGGAQIDEERLRVLLREFIAKNAQAFGVTATKLSLEGVSDAGSFGKRYVFVQHDYSHPIVPPAGRLEIIANTAGTVVQISDTAIPVVQLPTTANVSREDAAKRVLGMTFTYGDIAGRPQNVTISDPKEIAVKDLVVYPEQLENALRIRLAWEVKAGTSLPWTVFVDAITGDIAGQRQDFQT